jgi:hypothetical protein
MNENIKTTFAGLNPWAGLSVKNASRTAKEGKLAPKKKPPTTIEKAPNKVKGSKSLAVLDQIGTVEITNDKPKKRIQKPSKYEEVFKKLQPGQSVKCEPRHAHAIANAMRSWQRRRNLDWTTAITLDYGDGFARVFRVK